MTATESHGAPEGIAQDVEAALDDAAHGKAAVAEPMSGDDSDADVR